MTREEALKILKNDTVDTSDDWCEAFEMAIKALEQEPCDEEYIKVPKKALKYRTAGMVAYNAEWLKNHFDIERTAICGAQYPCDAVSREAAVNACLNGWNKDYKEIVADIKVLPSVTPAGKVGHWEWIQYDGNPNIGNWHCSECRTIIPHMPEETDSTPIYKWCPMCGAKIREEEDT